MKEIVAANLIRYRKSLSISQEQLAEQAGVTLQSIHNYENAKTLPDSKILSTLARVLGVKLDDLLRLPTDCLPSFRFRTDIDISKYPQFIAQVLRTLQTYNALEQAVEFPTYTPESTPCHQVEGNQKRIQSIAALFRHRLGLGDAPIVNLFQSVEEIGLKVIRQSIPIKDFSSLSACSETEGAFVLINTNNITIERQLFSLARELGHLIFHRVEYQETLSEDRTEEDKAREEVAKYFASHLLVPQAEFERMYAQTKNIIELKRHFRVSYEVVLSRLSEMEVIDLARETAKISANYKQQNNGVSLQNNIELAPELETKEFPENERYEYLIWNALELDKISELKAAELLNITIEKLRMRRLEREVYAVA